MPLISVIVPVYKVEPYLKRCVDSILAQTFTNFELILVDDGSPDNCPSICDEYANKDSRIHVIHQRNQGLSAARNTAIDWSFSHSDSHWLTFIDSDDWIHPRMLDFFYKETLSSDVPIIACDFRKIDSYIAPEQICNPVRQTIFIEDFYLKKNTAATTAWAKLYKKDSFRTVRYPIGRLHEDEFVTYKILFSNPKIIFIFSPLYYYFNNNNGITNSIWTTKRLDVFDAFKAQLSFFKMKKLHNVYKIRLKHLLYAYHIQIQQIKETKKYLFIRKYLETKMKLLLLKTHIMKITTFQEDAYMYETAFPFFMKIFGYWKYLSKLIHFGL